MEGCECPEATGRHAQVSRMDNCNRLGRTEWGKRENSPTQRFGARTAYDFCLSTGGGDWYTSAASIGV